MDYPKMVYKSRQDYKTAQNEEEYKALIAKGYGEAKDVLFKSKKVERGQIFFD